MSSKLKGYAGITTSFLLGTLPLVAFAQIDVNNDAFDEIQGALESVYDVLAPILVTLVIIYILYGAFRFATAGGDEDQRQEGKNILLYGAVGLIILGSLLGLIGWVLNTITVDTGAVDVNDSVGGFD